MNLMLRDIWRSDDGKRVDAGLENQDAVVAINTVKNAVVAPDKNVNSAHATVSVNNLGALDLLQAAVSGLKPGQKYALWLVESRTAPFGQKEARVTFQANLAGAQIAQTVGPLRKVLNSSSEASGHQRLLLIIEADGNGPTLVSAK